MDFVTGLPKSEGFNAIEIVADRLGKLRHLIPFNNPVVAKATAQLYLRHVWKHYGLPRRIVSNRGTQYYGVTPATITSCGILCASTEARADIQVDVVWILYHPVMTCLEFKSLNSRSQKF